MPNRLALEKSPYLRQHGSNPVEWFPWCNEAFEKARREGKPIFLSIGYSSCHWCHVMERESFDDLETARLLNDSYISVKVDREERPDVDECYMAAVQLYSGRGGWPMSVWLTPELKPFAAGTYFPPQDRAAHPGFKTVLRHLAELWAAEQTTVREAAERLASDCARALGRTAPDARFTLEDAVSAVIDDFDESSGGFGGAPKFPPHGAIEFLTSVGGTRATEVVAATLAAMESGGIHDHVGGGFHRYSTDEHWRLPHFEKMLYDNALLLRAFSEFNPATAAGIANWLEREMSTPSGLYASALDADTDGEEGLTYTWTAAEIREVLGDASFEFEVAYDVRLGGNFHEEGSGRLTGRNILVRTGDKRFEKELGELLEARMRRPQPRRDDKCVVAWNALAIPGLLRLGRVDKARSVALAILEMERKHGALPQFVMDADPAGLAFLDGYAYFAEALIAFGAEFRSEAERIVAAMIERFLDFDGGGFWFASSEHESLLARTKPVFDSPIPSPNASAIRACFELGHRHAAHRAIAALGGWIAVAPTATCSLASAAFRLGDQAPLVSPRVSVEYDREAAQVVIDVPDGMYLNGDRSVMPLSIKLGERSVPFVKRPEQYTGRMAIPLEAQSGEVLEVRFLACTATECLLPEIRRIEV